MNRTPEDNFNAAIREAIEVAQKTGLDTSDIIQVLRDRAQILYDDKREADMKAIKAEIARLRQVNQLKD